MESFYILDCMALLYRAFYAFINSPMRSSSGLNTSGMFGFLNTVVSLIEREKPDYLVACFDPAGKTFRHERFPEYKATRQAAPQELKDSIPWIIEILEALRIPIVRLDGYEADDLIGTFTRMADESGYLHSFMVSKDKDLGQLLSPTCSFCKPGNKAEFERINMDEFLEEWGISRPEQIIDILALMGDSSDNIPGVPGVGAVTARKLIGQFGSVENMLANTPSIKGKLREKVEAGAQNARLSYELATIRRDANVGISLEECRRREFDLEKLENLLIKLEFNTLIKKFCAGKAPKTQDEELGELFRAAAQSRQARTPAAEAIESEEAPVATQPDLFSIQTLDDINTTPHNYALVDTPEARKALAARLEKAPVWAFDTETTGLDPLQDRLLGMSFCLAAHEAYYVPVTSVECLEPFRKAFAGSAEKIGLNLKFDLRVMHAAGVEVAGPFFDVLLVHQVLYPELRHNMDGMAENLLQYRTIHLEDIAGKDYCTEAVPLDSMRDYAAEDADITWRLAEVLRPQLISSGQEPLMQTIEFPLVPVLAAIEDEGMRMDPACLEESSAQMGDQINKLHDNINAELNALVGHTINLNSPRQLGDVLFGELKLVAKPKKTRTGQFVTDEETLRKLEGSSPLVADILTYRELSKLKNTYLDALPRFISPKDGRIHSSLLQMVTSTGRLACQNPNLQNIPVRSDAGKSIRRAFVPRDANYRTMSADYSQVELRIMAAMSGDEAMINAFISGRDVHAETASRIFGVPHDEVTADMRRAAKTVNFGIIYGISAFGLSQRLNCSRVEADTLIKSYFKEFPGVKRFMDELVEKASSTGYAETLCGRRRMLPDLTNRNFNLRAAAERNAINSPIQGSAADMIKLAMIRVAELLRGRRSRLIMQIHDELLFDLHREEEHELPELVRQAMQNAMPLPNGVPLLVEIGVADNWLEAH